MPLQRTAASLRRRAAGPVTLAYERRVASGALRRDPDQLSLSSALDGLYSSLSSPGRGGEGFAIPDDHVEAAARYYAGGSTPSLSSLSTADNFAGIALATARSYLSGSSPKGIYVHGSVGVGKSMAMDLFYSICKDGFHVPGEHEGVGIGPIRRRLRRCHFHEFTLDVHRRIHGHKARHPRSDPIPAVAAELARESRLLCLDEMQVTDIADAMIIKRLMTLLLDLGVVVVTTSNRPPCGLYEGGINRSVFLPFVDTLRERMDVIEMGGTHDYRRDCPEGSTSELDASSSGLPTYFCTRDNPHSNSKQTLERWFSRGAGESRKESIPVAMGRSVEVLRANDTCGWFAFDELCDRPLGAADYLAIAGRFETVIVEDVPQLGGNTYNEARRFMTLIDALYEARTRLVISAAVPRDELFVGFDASVETHDGDEEIATEGASNEESVVVGEGGSSSSSSTTLIRTRDGHAEWSATGRIGVSLAQLSAVREVSFSFERAESRLAEMSAASWGRGNFFNE